MVQDLKPERGEKYGKVFFLSQQSKVRFVSLLIVYSFSCLQLSSACPSLFSLFLNAFIQVNMQTRGLF